MKLQTLTIILLFKIGFLNGQELFFNENEIDTIEIISHLSSYQFDDNGTTEGKSEILTITNSKNKENYFISEYKTEEFTYSSKTNKEEIKKSWRKKYNGNIIEYEKLNEFNYLVNKKTIKKVAKKNNLIWQLRPYYSTREMNKEFFEGGQSLDTIKIYLAEQFNVEENNGAIIVTDFESVIEIHIKTKKRNYRFQGKHPNPFRQPWYDLTDLESIETKSLSNLKINLILHEILPKKFLNKESISIQKLMNNYILWYFKRREMDYSKKKSAANGYNGNSSHAVAAACSRGRQA